MRSEIYGRKDAISTLEQAELNDKSVMLGIYGRRRIGKTHLIDEYFKDESEYLYIKNVGIKNEPADNQVKSFHTGVDECVDSYNNVLEGILKSKGQDISSCRVQKQKLDDHSWESFFKYLALTIESLQNSFERHELDRKIVYFFDEVPYAAEMSENFANRLAAIWESRFKGKNDLIFILCGSAASWMIQEIADATGGLNSRCELKIPLKPFTHREMINYLAEKFPDNVELSKKDAAKLYMCIGGVAKYLDYYGRRAGLMFNQSISNLMFSDFKDMRNEFDILMDSIFKNAEIHKQLILYLAAREKGASEQDIIKHLEKKGVGQGDVNRGLKELVDCDYLMIMDLIRPKGKEVVYRLIDEYCRFYFKWIYEQGAENFHDDSNYWNNEIHNTKIWFGTSFEVFCFRNKEALKKVLDLTRFNTKFFSFSINTKGGAEGDVVVEASLSKKVEGVFIIENKFQEGRKYSIDDKELNILINKMAVLKEAGQYGIDPTIIFITSDGVIENKNYKKLSTQNYTIADL